MLAWQNTPKGMLVLPGLQVRPLGSAPRRMAKFDLTLSLQDAGRVIVGGLEYATALFEPATIERHLGYFRTLLEAMVVDEAQAVHHLPILPEWERNQLLHEWNDTTAEFAPATLTELFEQQVGMRPDAVSVVCGGENVTYEALNERANRLGHYLRGEGVGPEAVVGVCLSRSVEMIVALLGVLKAGGAYLPLDVNNAAGRVRYMLDDARAKVVLNEPEMKASEKWQRGNEQSVSNLDHRVCGENLAYVIYTSGSTGQPKGVGLTHNNAVSFLNWAQQ